jgi:uncharacterized membrane protein
MNRKRNLTAPKTKREAEDDRYGLERLVFFSDAVFAIAITLLALEIRLPASEVKLTDPQLMAQLLGMGHKYMAYLVSFLVIGTFWIGHHHKFRLIRKYDAALLFLNMLMLMSVAFMPFPSSIISEYSGRTATIFYAGTVTLASCFSLAIWWYASRNNRLVNADLTEKERRRQVAIPLMTCVVFLSSIGLAYIDPGLARLAWMLYLPASILVLRE